MIMITRIPGNTVRYSEPWHVTPAIKYNTSNHGNVMTFFLVAQLKEGWLRDWAIATSRYNVRVWVTRSFIYTPRLIMRPVWQISYWKNSLLIIRNMTYPVLATFPLWLTFHTVFCRSMQSRYLINHATLYKTRTTIYIICLITCIQ